MAANDLSVTWADLRREVAREMGWTRTYTKWNADRVALLDDILKGGYRQFINADVLPGENKTHGWSFLYPLGRLTLNAAYSTGTITVSSDVGSTPSRVYAIIATGTWPSWVLQGRLWYTGTDGVEYAVNPTNTCTTSTTRLVLDDTAGVAAAGTSFVLRRTYYNLPDDFGGMYSDGFTFRRDEQWHLPDVQIVGEAELRRWDRSTSGDVYPRLAALVPTTPNTGQLDFSLGVGLATAGVVTPVSEGTRWKAQFYPQPEQTYYLEYRYHSIPPALDETTNLYHHGGMEHSETIIASCVDVAYQKVHASYEKHEHYISRLRQSILRDRRFHEETHYGQGSYSTGQGSMREALRDFRQNTPTSNITTPW